MQSKDSSIDQTTKHTMHRLIYKAQSYGLGSIIGAYLEDELVAGKLFFIRSDAHYKSYAGFFTKRKGGQCDACYYESVCYKRMLIR